MKLFMLWILLRYWKNFINESLNCFWKKQRRVLAILIFFIQCFFGRGSGFLCCIVVVIFIRLCCLRVIVRCIMWIKCIKFNNRLWYFLIFLFFINGSIWIRCLMGCIVFLIFYFFIIFISWWIMRFFSLGVIIFLS